MNNISHLSRWRFAAKVAGCHLLLSLLIATATAWVVFGIWYPAPYDILVGGAHLYGLVVAVDVVCGPLLTLILVSPAKSKRETVTDLSLVAVIQIGALIYGLHTVAVTRPVVAAFETDRFTVVSAAEINQELLQDAPKELQHLSWRGIRRVGIREPINSEEKLASLELSLQGIEPSARPNWWLPDGTDEREKIKAKMQPLSKLITRYPDNAELDAAIQKTGLQADQLYYLPFTSQKNKEWTVLLDKETKFKAFVPLDSF